MMRMLALGRIRSYHTRIPCFILLLAMLQLQACTRTDLPGHQAPSVPTRDAPAPQDRSLDNLIAFTRLLGYARHFHPSDEAATTNWDEFAVRGVLAVENATSAADLVERLKNLFRPIAPTIRIFRTGEQPPVSDLYSLPHDASPLYVVSWKHTGFGGGIYQQIGYSSERIRTPLSRREADACLPDPTKPYYADLGGGVSALVPLAFYADEQGTLPHGPRSPELELSLPTNDRAKRLATVALSWNIFQHFYPYFDVVPVDWLDVLKETLAAARTDDEYAFLKTLRRMVAQLQDGHGAVGTAMSAQLP